MEELILVIEEFESKLGEKNIQCAELNSKNKYLLKKLASKKKTKEI